MLKTKTKAKQCRTCGKVKRVAAFPVVGKRQDNSPVLRLVCLSCKPYKPCLTRGKTNPYRLEGETAYIALTNRADVTIAETIIDAADLLAVLARGRWHLKARRHTSYVQRTFWKDGRDCKEQLHRFLMNPPAGLVIDHVNFNGLDNRRVNLRIVTHKENCENRKPSGPSAKGGNP